MDSSSWKFIIEHSSGYSDYVNHGNISHQDSNPHSDSVHTDHSDHSEVSHSDSYPHSNSHGDYADHSDEHSDIVHSDTSIPYSDGSVYSDIAPGGDHSDWQNYYKVRDGVYKLHSNVAWVDISTHNDTWYPHVDNAGSGSHNDWLDTGYVSRPYGDYTDHVDVVHTDSHTDTSPHSDSHSDSSTHEDISHSDWSDHDDAAHNDWADHSDTHSNWNDTIDIGDK